MKGIYCTLYKYYIKQNQEEYFGRLCRMHDLWILHTKLGYQNL